MRRGDIIEDGDSVTVFCSCGPPRPQRHQTQQNNKTLKKMCPRCKPDIHGKEGIQHSKHKSPGILAGTFTHTPLEASPPSVFILDSCPEKHPVEANQSHHVSIHQTDRTPPPLTVLSVSPMVFEPARCCKTGSPTTSLPTRPPPPPPPPLAVTPAPPSFDGAKAAGAGGAEPMILPAAAVGGDAKEALLT